MRGTIAAITNCPARPGWILSVLFIMLILNNKLGDSRKPVPTAAQLRGTHEYFILSLKWAPTYNHRMGDMYGRKRIIDHITENGYFFTIHGLWNWPNQYHRFWECPHQESELNEDLLDEIQTNFPNIKKYWPSDVRAGRRTVWKTKWEEDGGKCITTLPGIPDLSNALEFFGLAVDYAAQVDDWLNEMKLTDSAGQPTSFRQKYFGQTFEFIPFKDDLELLIQRRVQIRCHNFGHGKTKASIKTRSVIQSIEICINDDLLIDHCREDQLVGYCRPIVELPQWEDLFYYPEFEFLPHTNVPVYRPTLYKRFGNR